MAAIVSSGQALTTAVRLQDDGNKHSDPDLFLPIALAVCLFLLLLLGTLVFIWWRRRQRLAREAGPTELRWVPALPGAAAGTTDDHDQLRSLVTQHSELDERSPYIALQSIEDDRVEQQ